MMTKVRYIIYKLYDLSVNQPFCTAVILFICLFLKLNMTVIIPVTFAIAVLSVLSFNKRYTFLKSLLFVFCFLIFEIINVVLVMKDAMFASLTLLYSGIFIILGILFRAATVFLVYYLTNIILFKIINSKTVGKYTDRFLQFFRKESFVLVLFSVLTVSFSVCYSVKYFITVPVNITSFSELKENYFFGFENKIHLLKDNKLCFMRNNQIIIYDLKNHEIFDKYTLTDFNNIKVNNTEIEVRAENRIFPLSNGNILILQNYIPQKRKDYNYNSKTYIKVYMPKKGEISSFETPLINKFISITEMPDNKILFIGNKEKETYIYDYAHNTFSRSADLNSQRSGASAILLQDGRIFVLGGQTYPNNYAEIYDIKKDVFEKIPLNFNLHNYINTIKLSLLNDGRVLIQCEKANKNEKDGIGSQHGFRTQDGKFITVYPVPYLTIFNPKDNSFEEIDINKNSNHIRVRYETAVLQNGNIIIVGGGYVDKDNSEKRKRMKNTQDILVYNIKNHTVKKTFKDLKYYHYGNDITTVLDDGTVLVTGNIYDVANEKNQIEALRFKR